MERYEMAELLSKKAGVSLEDARQALEENEWDMLDAMVALERRNRSMPEPVALEQPGDEAAYSEPQPVKSAPKKEKVFSNGFAMIWHYIKRVFQLAVETNFTILRHGKELLTVPVIVLAILLICCFWVVVPLLIVGLFLDCRYTFSGKHGADAANRAMDKLGDVVENIKDTLDGDDNT